MAVLGQRQAVFSDMGKNVPRLGTDTFFDFVSTWVPRLSVEVGPHYMPIPLTDTFPEPIGFNERYGLTPSWI